MSLFTINQTTADICLWIMPHNLLLFSSGFLFLHLWNLDWMWHQSLLQNCPHLLDTRTCMPQCQFIGLLDFQQAAFLQILSESKFLTPALTLAYLSPNESYTVSIGVLLCETVIMALSVQNLMGLSVFPCDPLGEQVTHNTYFHN